MYLEDMVGIIVHIKKNLYLYNILEDKMLIQLLFFKI